MDPRGPADHQPNDPTMPRPAGPSVPPPQWGPGPGNAGWGPPAGGSSYPPAGGGWGPPPGQGHPYPPTGSYPAGPQRNNGKKWWFFGAGALAVAIAVVVAIAVIPGGDSSNTAETSSMRTITTTSATSGSSTRRSSTTTPTTTTVANVDPSALPGYFLDAARVGEAMGISGMVADPVDTNLISGAFSGPEGCGSIFAVTYEPAYAGSGYTAVARQTIRQEPKGANAFVQGIVAFPDEAAAKARYTQMMLNWDKCEGVQFDTVIGGKNMTFKSASAVEIEGTASLLLFNRVNLDSPGSDETDCERAITARKNVIVDVLACTPNQGNTGRQLARDIGQKITGVR